MLTVLFCAVLLALTILFAARTEAQETTAEQTVAQTKDATTVVKKTQETTAQTNETTTGSATENENTVAQNRDTSVEEPEQSVQQSGQQAQADPTEEDDAQTATRAATTPDGQPARIVESAGDPDEIVDRIVVPVAGCEVDAGAVLVVEDDDGTRVTLTNGQNVTITSGDDAITIVGTDAGGNLTDLDQIGGNRQFGTVSETVTGKIVRSSGIACGRDDGEGISGGAGGPDDCDTLAVLEGDDREAENFGFPGNGGRLRIVYSTLSPDGSIEINVGDTSRASVVSETVTGAKSGIISADITVPGRLFASVDPSDQTYKVTFEAVGGDDECTRPREQGGVLTNAEDDDDIVNTPAGNLPNTGGLPISGLAGCVALLLVGTAVMGTALRRRQ